MQKSKTHKKQVSYDLLFEIITIVFIVVLFLLCIMEKEAIKANYDAFVNTVDSGLRQWPIDSKDLLQ